MFWDKKEDKDSLPDLPPLKTPLKPAFDIPKPTDVEEDGDSIEKHGLPSFPDSPIQRGFSQTAIKDAVGQDAISENTDEIPHTLPAAIKTMEFDTPSQPTERPSFRLDEPPQQPYVPPRKPLPKSNDIFVKVERFNTAFKSIVTIRKKVDEIDSALRKIREVKMREEQELAAWEKELSGLKSRLQEVSDNLFE